MMLGASYQLNYRDSKAEVHERINERFVEEVPNWLNTISNILQMPQGGVYDRLESVRKTKTTILSAKDTVEISVRYFPRTDYEWWHNFYEFHKLSIDELEAFDYEEYKKNGFKVNKLGDFPLKLETKPE